jgi:hypothetical protein
MCQESLPAAEPAGKAVSAVIQLWLCSNQSDALPRPLPPLFHGLGCEPLILTSLAPLCLVLYVFPRAPKTILCLTPSRAYFGLTENCTFSGERSTLGTEEGVEVTLPSTTA